MFIGKKWHDRYIAMSGEAETIRKLIDTSHVDFNYANTVTTETICPLMY